MKPRNNIDSILKKYKSKSIKYRTLFIIIAALGVAIIFIIFSVLSKVSDTLWIQSIPYAIGFVGVSLCVWVAFNVKLEREFKIEVSKTITSSIDFECLFKTEKIETKIINDSRIIKVKEQDKVSQNYTFYGNKDIKFESCYYKVIRKTGKEKFIPFEGRIFSVDLDNTYSTMIIKKETTSMISNITNLNKTNKYNLDLFYDDKILFEDKLEKLSNYMKRFDMSISIINNKLYIAATNLKQHFDLFSDNITSDMIINEYSNELNMVKDVYQLLF